MTPNPGRAPAQSAAFWRFCVVGGLGFAVDAGTTLILVSGLGMPASGGRIVAFLLAVTATWMLHRSYTFPSHGTGGGWWAYLGSSLVGAAVNIGVYLAWLWWVTPTPRQLVLAVALGSAAALLVNFNLARRLVFRTKP